MKYNTTVHPVLHNIDRWFQQAKPNPTKRDIGVQMGVHFEEVGEMLDCVLGSNKTASMYVIEAKAAIKALASHMKANGDLYGIAEEDRVEMLDALCDQIVTAVGVGKFAGMNVPDAAAHVDDSNWSKFQNGTALLDQNGKIIKGPNYFRPDLKQYV